ncbi:PhoX domain-containing protein [Flagelloscypha sp. PMI_526]|nr:PhoX domain-containing protein [Flagelloscypha sp. PMI_526]
MNISLTTGVGLVLVPLLLRLLSPWFLGFLLPAFIIVLPLASLGLTFLFAHFLDAKRSRRATNTLAAAATPFAFSSPAAWEALKTRSQWQNSPQTYSPIYPDSPAISQSLNEIIAFILRDFVQVWYKELSSSPVFPNAVGGIIHDSLEALLERATTIDLATLVVRRILPHITNHIDHFRQSEMALRGAGLERKLTQSEELDLLLAGRYASSNSKGKLHPAVDNLSTAFTKQSEEAHLRQLVDKALPLILPETEAASKALVIVAREIVSCSVLYPVMEMLSDPDFWNRIIDQVAGNLIHQQRLITKVRNVLDAQSSRSQNKVSAATPLSAPAERITIHTDARQFESFLRSINRTSSLLDARRLKNDILGEIRRTRTSLANHENEDWISGEKTEDVVAFLDRLYTAKRNVEERIIVLGGGGDDSRQSTYQEAPSKASLSLREILRNPSSLSYFMEFMDRRQRSLLVQFWLTVESFKNPLEPVDVDSDSDSESTSNTSLQKDPGGTIREDILMIHELYFSGPTIHPLLSKIPKKYAESIQGFALAANAGEDINPVTMRKVRKHVLLAQRQLERDMEHDFEDFERSELWHRVVEDSDVSGPSGKKASPVQLHPPPLPSPPPAQRTFPGRPLLSSIMSAGTKSTPNVPQHGVLPRAESSATLPTGISRPETPAASITSPKVIQRTDSHDSTTSQRSKKAPGLDLLMTSPSASTFESSRAPLFDDPDDHAQRKEEQQMEAIQAALSDIMALDGVPDDDPEDGLFGTSNSKRRPVDTRNRIRGRAMFDDDDEDEGESSEETQANGTQPAGDGGVEAEEQHSSFRMPAPGDLHLSYEIGRLGEKIERLRTQDTMIDTFIKKAELTGDTRELRLLNKSKQSLARELRELQFQKTQYEQQESANRLVSERTKVAIAGSTESDEDGSGKSVVRYLVEVQQLAPDGTFASGWVVARRYNEFLALHTKLKEKHALVRGLEFPGKRLVTQFSAGFVDTRRVGLEKYMQSVIAIPKACESEELRAFLSRDSPFETADFPPPTSPTASELPKSSTQAQSGFGTGLVRNVYRTFTESIDDMFFGPSMLDVLIQRLTRQAAELAGLAGTDINEDLVTQALNATFRSSPMTALLQFSGDLKPLDGETSASSFSAPICDLFLAAFELNKENNWLRKQAIVLILQQVLGGTIERKLREVVDQQVLEESRILFFLSVFRDGLWPGGKLKPPSVPRLPEEKMKTRDEANKKLSMAVPDFAANMIGRSNARRGARRIFAVLQNRRLNQHIVYTVVDEVSCYYVVVPTRLYFLAC